MADRNEAVVREAYEAYGRGDVARMEDRSFLVLPLAQEPIIRMRACRDRDEARAFAGIT